MSILGKIHEISMYGLISAITCIASGKVSIGILCDAAVHPVSFIGIFKCYLFWATVLFIPIAVLGAIATKYYDGGEGLTFHSNHILVIAFAHIAEELMGLCLTPFWFIRDVLFKRLTVCKTLDYLAFLVELVFIIAGILSL